MIVLQEDDIYQDRMKRWVHASHSVGNQDDRLRFLVTVIQSLGRLDCQLIKSAGNALPTSVDSTLFPFVQIKARG